MNFGGIGYFVGWQQRRRQTDRERERLGEVLFWQHGAHLSIDCRPLDHKKHRSNNINLYQ
jgi:hypothetical protein